MVWTFGEMVLTPVASSTVAALSAPRRVARDQALLSAAQMFGLWFGPVIGVLAYTIDPPLPWLGGVELGVAGALAIGLTRRVASHTAQSRAVTTDTAAVTGPS